MRFPQPLLLVLALAVPVHAEPQNQNGPIDYETARLERRLMAVRTYGDILLDGALEEGDWREAPVAKDFIQSEPREGEPATFDTEVRVLYDDQNLYIGVRAYDDEPDKLIIRDLTRDYNTRSVDSFAIILDTFHDRRNSYMFQTNPMGAKYDTQSFNEGQESNSNWDGVWHVATRIVETGWTAEISIPFKTLKFSDAAIQTWGVNFMRRNRRLNEDSFWSPIPRIHTATRVSLAGTLEEMRDVRPGSSFKLMPYVTGDVTENEQAFREGDFDAGLDAKIGIGAGLTLDLTLNTDFSQVEADVQQVNLTRFSLFFPEKRDFFLENSGIFRFGPPESRQRRAFRSSFGLAAGGGVRGGQSRGNDLLLFFSRRIGLSEEGEPIPVRAGGRLTGGAGPYQLGFLGMLTGEEVGISTGDAFSVVRVKRNVFANSDIGVMFINRDTMDSSHYNRSIGVDGNFRLNPAMDVNAYIAKTATPGLEGDDFAGRIAYAFTSRSLNFSASYSSLQDNFNPEVGFAPRLGVRRARANVRYRYRQPWWRGIVREIGPNVDFDHFTDQQGKVVSRYVNVRVSFRLQSGGFVALGRRGSLEQPTDPFEIHPTTMIEPGFYTFGDNFFSVFTDPSRLLSGNVSISSGDFYSGKKQTYSLGGVLKLGGRLTAEAAWSFNDVDVDEGAFTTHLVTTRFVYAFSTRMFLNGLVQYNSVTEEWSSNIRFNFIYLPLSEFFLVYNERRDDRGQRIDRALIAKFTYLFDF